MQLERKFQWEEHFLVEVSFSKNTFIWAENEFMCLWDTLCLLQGLQARSFFPTSVFHSVYMKNISGKLSDSSPLLSSSGL